MIGRNELRKSARLWSDKIELIETCLAFLRDAYCNAHGHINNSCDETLLKDVEQRGKKHIIRSAHLLIFTREKSCITVIIRNTVPPSLHSEYIQSNKYSLWFMRALCRHYRYAGKLAKLAMLPIHSMSSAAYFYSLPLPRANQCAKFDKRAVTSQWKCCAHAFKMYALKEPVFAHHVRSVWWFTKLSWKVKYISFSFFSVRVSFYAVVALLAQNRRQAKQLAQRLWSIYISAPIVSTPSSSRRCRSAPSFLWQKNVFMLVPQSQPINTLIQFNVNMIQVLLLDCYYLDEYLFSLLHSFFIDDFFSLPFFVTLARHKFNLMKKQKYTWNCQCSIKLI